MNKNLESLVGKTIVEIELSEFQDELKFITQDGYKYTMLHVQDCCEQVRIESIVGDLDDLIDSPVLRAEEEVSRNDQDYLAQTDDSCTWTFYKFATRKGYVDIRWIGESNGYYSESVDISVEKIV